MNIDRKISAVVLSVWFLILCQSAIAPVLSQDTLDKRAVKYHSALGKDSPGIDSIKSTIINGSEDKLRDYAVAQQFLNDKALRQDLITEYAKSRPGGELQPGEREFLDSLNTPDLQSPSNILEKKWADYVVNSTLASSKDDKIKKAADNAPDEFDEATHWSTRLIVQRELVRRIREDIEASIGLWDSAKNFVPFYNWYTTTHVAPEDVGSSGVILKGDVLKQQISDMWLKSPEDFANKISEIKVKALNGEINPENAAEFLKALEGYGASDVAMGNTTSYLNIVFSIFIVIITAIKTKIKEKTYFLISNGFSIVAMLSFPMALNLVFFVYGIGALYWLWMSIKLNSFLMFVLGVLPPVIIFTGAIGAYSLIFGLPHWVATIFG